MIVYGVTLRGAFLYDDELIIKQNRWVHDAGALPQILLKPLLPAPPAGATNYYRPVVLGLYNVTWRIGGGRPFAFHLLNVALHMINATLLLQLVRRVTGDTARIAEGSAILFAVHPLTTEVVAWPSCLPELTYAALGLAVLLMRVISWTREGWAARGWLLGAGFAFGLACACKESAVALIPLIGLLELWVRPARSTDVRRRWLSALGSAVPYVVAFVMFMIVRSSVLGGFVPRGFHPTKTPFDAALNAPWLLLRYVKSMLFPFTLLVEHLVPLATSVADPRFLVGAIVVLAGIAGALVLRRRRPDLAFAAAVAVLPILPALYLPALGRDSWAERYAYLGVAGFCWLTAGGLGALLSRRLETAPRRVLPAFVGVLAVAAGARTFARCADWHDDGTLGAATIAVEPRASIGYLLLGNWHAREGRKEDALRAFQDGVAHVPDNAELQLDAVALSIGLGRLSPQDAAAAYQRLSADAPANASVQYNLGQVLLEAGRVDEARGAFSRSLELAPASVPAMTALAVIASQRGDSAESIRLCRKALAIDARSTPALQQLAVALLRSGDTAGALAALERAIAIDPSDKETLNRLGVAYARAGRMEEARRSWERALTIDPGFAGARQNLDRLQRANP